MLRQVIEGTLVDRVEYSFNMAALNLTFRTARAAARERLSGVAGLIELRYIEHNTMSADPLASYTLYAQIESLN
jgi:hypothetical protein